MKIQCLLSFLLFISLKTFCCTTLLVTKGASVDGSAFIAHSEDYPLGDQRIIYVPAKDHPKGSKRAIYDNPTSFPRYLGKDKAPPYDLKGYPQSKPIGYIDEIEHTYAYFDGNYAIINEHQLALGECTDQGKFKYKPSANRFFNITELSRIALERFKKAKDAVKGIGELAEKYGYYDEAETLIIADTEEGWIFEITATPSGKGALWIAKKVPDGEVFVAANEFRIRDIDPNDSDILYSKDLFKIAEEQKWWDPQKSEKLDWLKAVSLGEFHHPYYSLRRIWSLQSRINPNLELSPWVEDGFTKEYPFSIKPAQKLSLQDVMDLYRDCYEGTEFDLTKLMAAGPFGSPVRYIGDYDLKIDFKTDEQNKNEGAWERPISIFYCAYTYINQIREDLPNEIGGVCWLSLDAPYTSCFIPFYVNENSLPHSFQYGNPLYFTHDFAWWAFNFVANWANLNFTYMKEDIKKMQKEIENFELKKQKEVESQALKLYKKNIYNAKKYLSQYSSSNAEQVVNKWWQLSYYLIEKYSDGYINKPKPFKPIGYPEWWRDQVNYKKGPTTYKKP